VLRFGGVKALTKHVHDDALKCHLSVEVAPEIIDNSMVIGGSRIMHEPKGKMKVGMVKSKVTIKRSRLEKATQNLYDLEEGNEPEKSLNVDFGIYQMENY
jgi:hypothetical protein